MRCKSLGSSYAVTVTAREVEDFGSRWPCANLPFRGVRFEFDSRNGDLLDVTPNLEELGADGGAVPGLYLGSRTTGALNTHDLKAGAGVIVAVGALALAWTERRPIVIRLRFLTPLAGFCGGFLGTSTGLIGIPPALLLTQRRVATRAFFADLAVYFVATSSIGLGVLAIDGRFSGVATRDTLYWLPGVIAANLLGTSLGVRLPDELFRRFALSVAFIAGVVTVVTA